MNSNSMTHFLSHVSVEVQHPWDRGQKKIFAYSYVMNVDGRIKRLSVAYGLKHW